ncbi:MAG: hypothetical protein OXB88_00355 [Bacteriovoracales bacterium]|nr:hypothetical protein [Bacteriovoracales bacterium]
MGITQLLDNFYEQVRPYQSGKPLKMVPGQIAWVPTLFLDKNMTIIDAERAGREDHKNIKLKFNRLNSNHFRGLGREKLPIPSIRLLPNEELMAFKAKKRPCIFISKAEFFLSEEEQKKLTGGKRHHATEDYIFVPLYSTHKDDESKGFAPQFVDRIKHFDYGHFVYMPDCKLRNLETNYPPKEGIARLDRLFVTNPIVPNVSPTDVKLTDEYFKILIYHLKEYLFQETESELHDLRECLKPE